ncbi:MAG: hypothetical protein ACE5OQ_02245 [Woeseia sp.]
MHPSCFLHVLVRWFIGLCLVLIVQNAVAHGSVVPDEDVCLIQIGYFKAHFKIYLPRTRQHEEFCEDIPGTGESVFVMEYVHGNLSAVPIDFRIIRDVTGLGRFARSRDIESIEDLDSATVFHHPAAVQPDVFTVVNYFDEAGWYVGIVTATPAGGKNSYIAVFPFKVGFAGFGYWPWFAALIVLLQLHFWYMSGSFSRWREWRNKRQDAVSEA